MACVWRCLVCAVWLIATAAAADPEVEPTAGATADADAGSDEAAEPEPEPDAFDPWAGIARDGRIAKPALPDGTPNPGRWRYIPEGRIKPGNVLQRFLVSSFIAPFITNDSDVGFGGGLALTDIDFRRQRRQEFLGLFLSYTTKGQQAYTAAWRRWLHHIEAEDGGVFQEERSFLRASVGYENALTRRFFGFGASAPEGAESSYADETVGARFGFDLAVPEPGSDWVVGAAVRGEWHSLGPGRVSDLPSMDVAFPEVFATSQEHWLLWLETELRYDTRDSQRMPHEGFAVGVSVDSALGQRGGDVGARFVVFGTKVFPLPPLLHSGGEPGEEHPPTDVLAFQLSTDATAGDLPFFSLPALGGSRTLRGFTSGRFRDRSTWHASAEYRFWVLPRGFRIPFTETLRIERVGLALFGDVGSVAPHWDDLFSSRVRANGGIGVRATLERSAPFRVDVGISSEGIDVSAGFGLSF